MVETKTFYFILSPFGKTEDCNLVATGTWNGPNLTHMYLHYPMHATYTCMYQYHFLQEGPKYIGVYTFLERKIGGTHKFFDDQNVGNDKMTPDSVFILFRPISKQLTCLGS